MKSCYAEPAPTGWVATNQNMANNRFLNFILAFSAPSEDGENQPNHSVYRHMVECAHNEGLRITHFFPAAYLRNPDAIELMKFFRDRYGDEIVPWLDADRALLEELDIKAEATFFHFYSKEDKKKLASAIMDMFRNVFGEPVEAAAFFNLDAASLKALKKASPELVTVMAGCFEEGVNVLHGHRYFDLEWLCLGEGGPWWPWVPKFGNSLAPAGPDDEKIDVVCVPHLNRDLIQSFDSRDDWYSSQPMDQMRSKSVNPKDITYTKRFFKEYMRQAEFNNGYAYYQFFEGTGPFNPEGPHVFDEPSAEYARTFEKYVKFLGEQVKKGVIKQASMAQFGKWFLKRFQGYTPPTIGLWRDIRLSSGKEYLWYLDSNLRLLFASNLGGSIIDMRPYAANIQKDTGMDTENLWDGSYPYLIQNHHRYTTMFKGMLKYDAVVCDLSEQFMKIKRVKRSDDSFRIIYEPKKLTFGDLKLTLETVSTVEKGGCIRTERRISQASQAGGIIEFCEYLRGTLGTTDMPTNLAGIGLEIVGRDGRKGLIYSHRGRQSRMEKARECRVSFPEEKFSLVLSTEDESCIGSIEEGTVFQAFYTLSLGKKIKLNNRATFVTKLKVEKRVQMPKDEVGSFAKVRFKTAWGPSLHPLRCPRCLLADREVHMAEEKGLFRCPFCSFIGNRKKVEKAYQRLKKMLST